MLKQAVSRNMFFHAWNAFQVCMVDVPRQQYTWYEYIPVGRNREVTLQNALKTPFLLEIERKRSHPVCEKILKWASFVCIMGKSTKGDIL